MKELPDDILTLITKYLDGEASAEEQAELREWIDTSEENQKAFREFEKVTRLTGGPDHDKTAADLAATIDVEAEWNQFQQSIGKPETKTVTMPKEESTASSTSQNWLKIAAAILLVAAATIAITYFSKTDGAVIFATTSETKAVTLPDGSTVTLSFNSSIAYTKDFGAETRSVNLIGEAFFEIEPDASKPFIVVTESSQVRVLGTSFNVRAYQTGTETEVVVSSGEVEFSANSENVQLVAGEKGVLQSNTGQLEKSTNEDANFLAWKTRLIVFEATDLEEVVSTLNKAYNVKISISGGVPDSCEVSVTFDQQSIEAVLIVLENTLDITYTINGDQIEFTNIGCSSET